TPDQCKVIRAISRCRTKALGADLYRCSSCGYEHVVFHSCRDRHCPVCQFTAREKWLVARKKELLPVPYFHVVFTLPDLLNSLMLSNPKALYDLLFKAASQTILKLAADKKHIGGQGGLLAILHTWGQNQSFHPHLHCVVPGGALSFDGNRWVYPKKSKKRKKFFVHVNIISQLFRNIFLHELKQLYLKGKLRICLLKDEFNALIERLYKIQWVTYCKPPFGSAAQVLDYLGRYKHRVAISNRRIIALENNEVSFQWRDYRDHNKNKIMSLPVMEFMRRFLLHVLPKGFFKIRYYGILSSRNRKNGLDRAQKLLVHYGNRDKTGGKINLPFKPQLCPCCKKGLMEVLKTIPRRFFLNNRSP
ncbi:MAG: IS91 family transposase, partial [Taibaiella sp.]|nr:IS91 family transposase [Taibaiella sp.]